MSNFPALEVVIGLTFVYFVLSLICSAVTEAIASRRGWRAAKLEQGVKNLLSGSSKLSPEGEALAKDVYEHPLIQALIAPITGKRSFGQGGTGRREQSAGAGGRLAATLVRGRRRGGGCDRSAS
jgi:hypothetical protein